GNAKRPLSDAAKMTFADVQLFGKLLDVAFGQHPIFDAAGDRRCQAIHRVHSRVARSKLRPAAQTRPESGTLCRGCAWKEAAALTTWCFCGTDGAAVNTRCGNADENRSIESSVMSHDRSITAFNIQVHAAHITEAPSVTLAVFGP